nr:class II fructose-bisphosphate aldolase [Actinoplanes solisilvae]
MITVEHAEAVVTGAEQANRPVILQISENAVRFHHGRLTPIAAAARGRPGLHRPRCPASDHVESDDLLARAAANGSARSCTTRPGSPTPRTSSPPPRRPSSATTPACG